MASMATQLSVPDGFPDLLRDYTRELLRAQPENIYEWSAAYFGASSGGDGSVGDPTLQLDLVELRSRIETMFDDADQGNKGFLTRKEAHDLIQTLSGEFQLSEGDILSIMAEADENNDNMIEYQEFIPLALEVFESLYAKTELHRQQEQAYREAEDLLLHGVSQEELVITLKQFFTEADINNDGTLSREEFRIAIKESGMGFTRKELNAMMHQVDVNGDDVISYNEFLPVALALCRDILAREIVAGKLPTQVRYVDCCFYFFFFLFLLFLLLRMWCVSCSLYTIFMSILFCSSTLPVLFFFSLYQSNSFAGE